MYVQIAAKLFSENMELFEQWFYCLVHMSNLDYETYSAVLNQVS